MNSKAPKFQKLAYIVTSNRVDPDTGEPEREIREHTRRAAEKLAKELTREYGYEFFVITEPA